MAEESLSQRLRKVLEIDPSSVAIEFEDESWSWGDLRRTIDAVTSLMQENGVRAHAAVGLMLRNRPPHLCALLGVLTNERCVVTINPLLPPKRLIEDVESLNLECIIAGPDDWAVSGIVG